MEQKDIIDFAKSAYEAFSDDTKKADLLIREFMRNGENLTKSQDVDTEISKQKWLVYTSLSFGISIIIWGVLFSLDTFKDKALSLIGIGILFVMVVGFSIASFIGFVKKW